MISFNVTSKVRLTRFFTVLIAVCYSMTPLQALAIDQLFYSQNDILFYDPSATTCGASKNKSTAETITTLRGNDNGAKIFNFWVDAGLTSQQAAGVTGSMQHEGGFSPFRQEDSKTWPAGGWGIAQFTGGERDSATTFVRSVVGDSLFNQYYKNDFGGAVVQSSGFIPKGIPSDVNDKFLLNELNYLLDHIQKLQPNSVRTSGVKTDYNQVIPSNVTLFAYLKSLVQAGDSAIAWTYLYEYPSNIKATAAARATSAAEILTMFGAGVKTTCGGTLTAGGMSLDQGIKFMSNYKNNSDNEQYVTGADKTCAGGPLANCVSFSMYFVHKYTTLKQSGAAGDGSTVVAKLISQNPDAKNGHSPQPYAIFSTANGKQDCGDVKCGHTGVILGVDISKGTVVVGEAGCNGPPDWNTAHEYKLSQFDSDAYTYIYTDSYLKGAVQ